jgi:hypothetical protein
MSKPDEGYEMLLYKRPIEKQSGAVMLRGKIIYKNVS